MCYLKWDSGTVKWDEVKRNSNKLWALVNNLSILVHLWKIVIKYNDVNNRN